MRFLLFLLVFFGLFLTVHASTNCSTGCDIDGGTLTDMNFTVPNYLLFENDELFDVNGKQISIPSSFPLYERNDVNFALRLPYFGNGSLVNIMDQNNDVLLSIDVSEFMTELEYLIGHGSGYSSNQNYRISYTLTEQPTGVLYSSSYVMQLGKGGFYGD